MSVRSATVVPDASVILKWVLDSEDEPGHAAANQLLKRWQRGEISLAVPPLWIYEVGNVLCLKRPADASEALAVLCDLGLDEVPLSRELIERTVVLAQHHSLTFYDASYLAVAEARKAVLVTADSKFHRRLPAGFAVELLVLDGP
jgi:predicted nucleic acid-binding protein